MATQIIPQDILDSLPKQFGQKTITQANPNPSRGNRGLTRIVDVIDPPANAIAITAPVAGRGGPREVPTGEYYIPLDMPNYPKTDAGGYPVPPLVAKYDASGKLQTITALQRYLGDAQNNISIQPEYSLSGELITTAPLNNAEGEGGGFGDFLGSALKDFGPMIALALGANYLAGSGLLSGGAGAAGGATAADIAASNALAQANLTGYAGTQFSAIPSGVGFSAATGAGTGSNFLSPEVISGAGGATPSATNLGLGGTGQDIPQLRDQLSRTPMPEITSGQPIAGEAVPGSLPEFTGEGLTPEVQQLIRDSDALAKANQVAQAAGGFTPEITSGLLGLGDVGSAILDFAKANPSLAGSLIGAVTSAIGAKDAPTSQTATTSIDPQIKQEYLANLERAKTTAAGLEARQIAQPGQMYSDAERNLYNLGMTPFGEADIARFFNPFQEQVVQSALGDIERTRQMQEQANMEQATRARAFGGTRQGVVSGMTNEAALRQSANTGAQLRQAGFNTAANLGLAARPINMAGLQTSLGLGTTRTALEQARLDALRNLGTERLAITSGALGLQPANVGQTSTTPLYNNTAGSLLSGGLTGAYIGSLLGKA